MKTLVFEPLKMEHTFVLNIEDKDKVSQSYKGNKVPIAWDFLDAIYGDKNIYSTPHDLLKFDLATYSPNYLTPELKAEMLRAAKEMDFMEAAKLRDEMFRMELQLEKMKAS